MNSRIELLKDVAFFQEGPGLRNWQWTTNGMKVINVTNILGDEAGTVNVTNTDKYISLEEFRRKYSHFEVEEGDYVVASSGNTYGKSGKITKDCLPLMMNTSVIRFRSNNKELLDNGYLYVFLRSSEFKKQIEQYVTGSAQPNFGPSHLKRMKISLPSLPTQRKIAKVLSAYDDLIENNTKRIRILERMAEELYKEWFVRFRFPGHEKAKFVNGLPEGWRVERLKNVLKRYPFGRTYKSSEVNLTGDVIVIDQSDSKLLGYHSNPPDHVATYGEPLIVFGDHTCKFALMTRVFSLGENVIPFREQDGSGLRTYYLFYATKDLIKTEEYKRHWSRLVSMKIVVPKCEVQMSYECVVREFEKEKVALSEQNALLARQRDLLLPRLMSGKLSVEGVG